MKKKLPTITTASAREKAIKDNSPATFHVNDFHYPISVKRHNNYEILQQVAEQTAIEGLYAFATFDGPARRAVHDHNKIILLQAAKHDIDPDMIRAVMYAENARGHKFGLNTAADSLHISNSLMPMNIQKSRWSGLIGKSPDSLYEPENNIEASTVLLRRLTDKVARPSVEKIGTLWNNLGAEDVNDFGTYVGKVYRDKPWRNTGLSP